MGKIKRSSNGKSSLRDGGPFIAFPWVVMDCPAYRALSHPARSLLMEMARQFVFDNNGKFLSSFRYLKTRGWNSVDTITRAKNELIDAGFLYETVKGHRPKKASWYAVTWMPLDLLEGYDPGAVEGFVRSAYRKGEGLRPSKGVGGSQNEPSGGVDGASVVPWPGAVRRNSGEGSIPPHGNHLEKPSAQRRVS